MLNGPPIDEGPEGPGRTVYDRIGKVKHISSGNASIMWSCCPSIVGNDSTTRFDAKWERFCESCAVSVESSCWKARPDHIHMPLSIPPKYSIAHAIGYLKGKRAIRIHRNVLKTKGTLFGRSFWSRGYCVSTVSLDEKGIRSYIPHQGKLQKEQEQAELEFM